MEKNKKLENFISANLRAAVLWLKCCRYGVLKHPLAINQANVVHVTKKKKNETKRAGIRRTNKTEQWLRNIEATRENNNLTDNHQIGNKIKQNLRHDNYNTMPLNHQQSQPLKWGHKQKRKKNTTTHNFFDWLEFNAISAIFQITRTWLFIWCCMLN